MAWNEFVVFFNSLNDEYLVHLSYQVIGPDLRDRLMSHEKSIGLDSIVYSFADENEAKNLLAEFWVEP